MQDLSIQGRTMSVSRAKEHVLEDDTTCDDMWVLYKPESDFINLSKLKYLELAKELEAMKRKESERTPTLKKIDLGEYGGSNRHHSKQYEGDVEGETGT